MTSISRREIDNLRNRIMASRKSKNYNERQMVDVPIELADALTALALDTMGDTGGITFVTPRNPSKRSKP